MEINLRVCLNILGNNVGATVPGRPQAHDIIKSEAIVYGNNFIQQKMFNQF